ncbi:MAG: DUF445 family protein [Planctomycetes bacterium]|nr:DUF445 family protein [Planctomycetota bacterium]
MPWWWVIPAALGGYYLYKELTREDEVPAGGEGELAPGEQRAVLPAPEGKPGEEGAPEAGVALPAWTRHIDPIGLGQFLRKHAGRIIPTSWTGALPRSAVPALVAEARNRAIELANVLFLPVLAVAALVLYLLGRTGTLWWSVVWGGVIGYGTNWLAIKMLFHPREKRPLLRWQGVVPSRRQQLLIRVTDGVCENLISEEIIRKYIEQSGFIESLTREHREHVREVLTDPAFRKDFQDLVLGFVARVLQSPEFRDEVVAAIEKRVDQWAGQEFRGKVVSFFRDWWRPQVKSEVNALLETLPAAVDQVRVQADRFLDDFPKWIERGGSDLESMLTSTFVGVLQRLDIRSVIYHQLSQFSETQMEEWVIRTANKELTVITLLGGLLGLAGGVVIHDPIQGLYMAAAGAAVLALDQAFAWASPARRKRRRKEAP